MNEITAPQQRWEFPKDLLGRAKAITASPECSIDVPWLVGDVLKRLLKAERADIARPLAIEVAVHLERWFAVNNDELRWQRLEKDAHKRDGGMFLLMLAYAIVWPLKIPEMTLIIKGIFEKAQMSLDIQAQLAWYASFYKKWLKSFLLEATEEELAETGWTVIANGRQRIFRHADHGSITTHLKAPPETERDRARRESERNARREARSVNPNKKGNGGGGKKKAEGGRKR